MTELDPDGFARGINDAIRALRAVYGGVRTMLDELAAEAQSGPDALYQLPVKVKSITSKSNPDERFLRTWEGRFYAAEPVEDDDDADEEDSNDDDDAAERKAITLTKGQNLGFVKVVLFHHDAVDAEPHHPHLLYGVLRDCRTVAVLKQLKVRRSGFRRILDVVHLGIKLGELPTKASVVRPPGVSKKGKGQDYKLVWRVTEAPASYRLFDLRGREQVREVVSAIKRLGVLNGR